MFIEQVVDPSAKSIISNLFISMDANTIKTRKERWLHQFIFAGFYTITPYSILSAIPCCGPMPTVHLRHWIWHRCYWDLTSWYDEHYMASSTCIHRERQTWHPRTIIASLFWWHSKIESALSNKYVTYRIWSPQMESHPCITSFISTVNVDTDSSSIFSPMSLQTNRSIEPNNKFYLL